MDEFTVTTTAAELEQDQLFSYDGEIYAVATIDEESGTVVGVLVEDGSDTVDLDPGEEVLVEGE